MKFSRIASIVIILISIGSLYCVHMLRQGRDGLREDKAQLTEDVKAAKAQVVAAEAKVQEANDKLPPIQKSLAKVTAEMESTKKTLDTTTQEREKLKTSLAATEKKISPINAQLAAAKEALKKAQNTIASQAAEIATIAGFKKQIEALTAENKALGGRVETALAEVKRLELQIEDLLKTPINLRGRIDGIEGRWNFIVLDIGQDQKVRKDTQFFVYRDRTFICKAQVISVSQNTSVAEVLSEFRRGDPRVGDLVIH
ncbi:MAG: hypothetical protein FJ395_01450 [Verrucomicrobia bacterium]|nr:hypothetical protein [Verrucomicrobiota bacterium]